MRFRNVRQYCEIAWWKSRVICYRIDHYSFSEEDDDHFHDLTPRSDAGKTFFSLTSQLQILTISFPSISFDTRIRNENHIMTLPLFCKDEMLSPAIINLLNQHHGAFAIRKKSLIFYPNTAIKQWTRPVIESLYDYWKGCQQVLHQF